MWGGVTFECSICLEAAYEPVVSVLWPPVLLALSSSVAGDMACCLKLASAGRRSSLLMGGSQKPQNPRLKTPPRPQGKPPASESRGGFQPLGGTGAFTSVWLFHHVQCL